MQRNQLSDHSHTQEKNTSKEKTGKKRTTQTEVIVITGH